MLDLKAEMKRVNLRSRVLWVLGSSYFFITSVDLFLLGHGLYRHEWAAVFFSVSAIFVMLAGFFMVWSQLESLYREKRMLLEMHRVRQGYGIEMDIELDVHCACGEKLIKRNAMTWVCPKNPWYSRFLKVKPHAWLVLSAEVVSSVSNKVNNRKPDLPH